MYDVSQANQRCEMAGTRGQAVSNSSVFNIRAKELYRQFTGSTVK